MKLHTLSILATALIVAGLGSKVHADLPLAANVVRAFKLDGWRFLCIGSDADIGICSANRRIGTADFEIHVSSSNYRFTANGRCVGKAITGEHDWDLDQLSAGVAQSKLVGDTETFLATLPVACKVGPLRNWRRSLEDASAYLIEFAD